MKQNSFKFPTVLLLAFFSTSLMWTNPSRAEVWTATQQWSAEWEESYKVWLKDHMDIHFFENELLYDGTPNPFHGLRTDCADTVYSFRMIFAWKHKLPFEINDPSGGQRLITNKMSRWDSVADENLRARRFLVFLFNIVSTQSVPNDTYPVAPNAEGVRSGTIILTTRKNHHSWTIRDLSSAGIPWLVFNSVVSAESRPSLLERHSWPNAAWVFEDNFTVAGQAGLRYWKPNHLVSQPADQVPGYSIEQYQIPLGQWVSTIQPRLARTRETAAEKVVRLLGSNCSAFAERVEAVANAEKALADDLQCWPYEKYDLYSTPNRDRRWMTDLLALRIAYLNWRTSTEDNSASLMGARLQKIFPFPDLSAEEEVRAQTDMIAIDDASFCVTSYLSSVPSERMDLAEAKRRLLLGKMSNNPFDRSSVRWGLETAISSDRSKTCPSWDPWTPNFTADAPEN